MPSLVGRSQNNPFLRLLETSDLETPNQSNCSTVFKYLSSYDACHFACCNKKTIELFIAWMPAIRMKRLAEHSSQFIKMIELIQVQIIDVGIARLRFLKTYKDTEFYTYMQNALDDVKKDIEQITSNSFKITQRKSREDQYKAILRELNPHLSLSKCVNMLFRRLYADPKNDKLVFPIPYSPKARGRCIADLDGIRDKNINTLARLLETADFEYQSVLDVLNLILMGTQPGKNRDNICKTICSKFTQIRMNTFKIDIYNYIRFALMISVKRERDKQFRLIYRYIIYAEFFGNGFDLFKPIVGLEFLLPNRMDHRIKDSTTRLRDFRSLFFDCGNRDHMDTYLRSKELETNYEMGEINWFHLRDETGYSSYRNSSLGDISSVKELKQIVELNYHRPKLFQYICLKYLREGNFELVKEYLHELADGNSYHWFLPLCQECVKLGKIKEAEEIIKHIPVNKKTKESLYQQYQGE